MEPDKPKGVGLLIGIKPKGDDDTSAAQAVLDAIEAKDPKALKAALKLCYAEE